MPSPITLNDLVIHFLNVGAGDTVIIEFPADSHSPRLLGIVDCYKRAKTLDYVTKIHNARPFNAVAFVCATHPHYDHIAGIKGLLNDIPATSGKRVKEFWDSGFRHESATYQEILETVRDNQIPMVRVSSGMEWYYGRVRVTALAPSVALRNRYATYGVDMNNASIVLRVDHRAGNVVTAESLRYVGTTDPEAVRDAGRGVIILGGDAEFDSWAQVSQEYPFIERTDDNEPLVTRMLNQLNCWLLKVSHHGSMHSAPLDVYERMTPYVSVVSNKQKQGNLTFGGTTRPRNLFPHRTTVLALEETKTRILTTDGSYESQQPNSPYDHCGTVVACVPPGGQGRFFKLADDVSNMATPPPEV